MTEEITNEQLKKMLSRKLALLRENSQQTIEATADSLDMDLSEYYMLLRGKRLPHLKTLLKINKKYGLNMDWWFGKMPELPQKQIDLRQKALELELLSSYRRLDDKFRDVLRETAKVFVRKSAS